MHSTLACPSDIVLTVPSATPNSIHFSALSQLNYAHSTTGKAFTAATMRVNKPWCGLEAPHPLMTNLQIVTLCVLMLAVSEYETHMPGAHLKKGALIPCYYYN